MPGRRAFSWMLKLYPLRFRAEYGDEMQEVFASALAEAAGLGIATAAAVWLRELRDLPVNLMRERRWDAAAGVREASMSIDPRYNGRGEDSGPAAEAPASWRESFAGAGLFLLLPALGGVYTAIYSLLGGQGPRPSPTYEAAGSSLFFLIVGGLTAVACAAWIRGFPRWSCPYLGFGLLFSLLMRSAASPGTTILGHEISRPEKLLWQAFVPALIVAGVALLITRSIQPLRQLAAEVWNDWSVISFALYGMLPIALVVPFDETHGGALVGMALSLVLGIGALAYMRTTRPWQRAAALAGGLAVSWLAATAWLTVYWHGRQEFWMSVPLIGYYPTAAAMSRAGAVLMVLLLAPGLLGVARWAVRRPRPST
jgi:hypothetical protein